jgi:hypothetical protein
LRQLARFDYMVFVPGLDWNDGPNAGLTTDTLRRHLHQVSAGALVIVVENGYAEDTLGGDVFIILVPVEREDWSFDNGGAFLVKAE